MADHATETMQETSLAAAVRLHDEGLAGNKEAVRKARTALRALHEQNPGDDTVKAYYGSSLALSARDSTRTVDRIDLAREGLSLLDQVVAAQPNNRVFRLMRGKIAYRLPENIFHRTETAIDDYVKLIDAEMRQPGLLDEKAYATLVYELGDAFFRTKRTSEARVCWKHLRKLTNDPKLLSMARTKLGMRKYAQSGSSKSNKLSFEPSDVVGMLIGLAGASLLRFAQRK